MKLLVDSTCEFGAARARAPAIATCSSSSARAELRWLSAPLGLGDVVAGACRAAGRRSRPDIPSRGCVRTQLRHAPIPQIAVDHEIAIQSRKLRLSHEDPADRFIAATARVHELDAGHSGSSVFFSVRDGLARLLRGGRPGAASDEGKA